MNELLKISGLPMTQEEKNELPELLPYIFPEDAKINSERVHFQFDPHGHLIAIINSVAMAFSHTDEAFHKTLLLRLQLPYLDAPTVQEQLERSIKELKDDPSKARFVNAMEYVLSQMQAPSPDG